MRNQPLRSSIPILIPIPLIPLRLTLSLCSYVLLIALGLTPLLSAVHAAIVIRERGKARIPLPNCYATREEMKANPAAHTFNCAQRAHANFLENAPQTMVSVLVAGLAYPSLTAVLGLAWLFSRVLYLVGYVYSGKEKGKGRFWGGTHFPMQYGIQAICVKMAWDLL
jgi:glutathione S-transferase